MGLINYIKDTKGELKHVSWPTRKQSLVYTGLVVLISVAISIYLGFFDWLFTYIVESLVI
ncbi:preprotein translocase subunit SecE [Candidatus Nomurabacteria bacterium]|nr:preprotein translocase subunit SecE [Candidatus Nomurabacteria bacterium]